MLDCGNQMARLSDAGQRRLRTIMVVCFYLLAVINGAIEASPPKVLAVDVLVALAAATVAAYGCVVDSRIVGRPVLQSLHWVLFVAWPVAVPIYLLYSRRLRGLGILVLHAIGLLLVATVAFHLTGYLAYGSAWFHQFWPQR
jgi:hypothetical protein